MLKVSDNARYLVYEDGTPFFYLADTAWASFGNVPLELWEPYLRYRKMQGINALQISILPIIHDRSVGPGLVEPFAMKENGAYDFSHRNEAYAASSRLVGIAEAGPAAEYNNYSKTMPYIRRNHRTESFPPCVRLIHFRLK